MSVETDVATIKKQIAHFLTSNQVQALVSALGSDHSTLQASLTSALATIAILQAEVQTLKDTIADHETRIAALE